MTVQAVANTVEFDAYGTGREEIISALPDDPALIERSQATLLFIAEAWIDGEAKEVDDGRHEFTVPLSQLHTADPGQSPHDDQWAIRGTAHNHLVEDELKNHERNRAKFTEWSGPFSIKLKSVDIGVIEGDFVVVPADALDRVADAAEEEARQLDDIPDTPDGVVEELDNAIATVKTQQIDVTDLRGDMEAINEIIDHALIELETGDLDALERSLRAINDRATGYGDD